MDTHIQNLHDADSYLRNGHSLEAAKYYAVFIKDERNVTQPDQPLLDHAYHGLDKALDGVIATLAKENRIAESTLLAVIKQIMRQDHTREISKE